MSAPRVRPTLATCGRCGATSFLRVAPVREHGAGGAPTPMAVAWQARPRELGPLARAVSCVGPRVEETPLGSYTIVLCTACGEVRWYARELDEASVDFPHAAIGACVDCGDPRALRVGHARTRGRGGQPSELRVCATAHRRFGFPMTRWSGHFSTFVCRGCGRTSWVAGGLDEVALPERGGAPCRRCTHTARFTVDPVNEDGATLRVLYDKRHLHEHRVGRFSLSICAGCGLTDWSAHELDALRPDATLGVATLKAGEGHEGPYR